MPGPEWICCQLGAREHYSMPRALAANGNLGCLYTDLWAPPHSLLAALPFQRIRDRYHEDLHAAPVHAFNWRALAFEAAERLRGVTGWPLIRKRNAWFQDCVLAALSHLPDRPRRVLFAYSYAARRIFDFARQRGWSTVLGQMDPGIEEERIVARLCERFPEVEPAWHPAPTSYWQDWRAECELADQILVNSLWSKEALLKAGVPSSKIAVVPLVYEPPAAARGFERIYPKSFSGARPLRALFLGQVNLRKGMAALLEVMRRMKTAPVRFVIAGPLSIVVPGDLRTQQNVHWAGPVPRSEAQRYYQEADVFLFPTHSDGFGLTQLEAQAWKLPVIASRFCGEVVEDGRNGLLLPEVTPEAIEAALARCLESPARLAAMSGASGVAPQFSLAALRRWCAEFEAAHV